MDIGTLKCKKCKNFKPIVEFPILQRGASKGVGRTANCAGCTDMIKGHRERKRLKGEEDEENLPPSEKKKLMPECLPLCKFEDFVSILKIHQNVLHIEAHVDLSSFGFFGVAGEIRTCRERAKAVAMAIGEAMLYHWTPEGHYSQQKMQATRFKFSCAQNKARQHDSHKTATLDKQCAKLPMFVFECSGWLNITIHSHTNEAEIQLRHEDDHVPYCVVSLLADVQELIINGPTKMVSQLWTECLQLYPRPNFSCKSVHYMWSQINSKKWTRHKDQFESTKILLKEGTEKGCLGEYSVCPIELPEEDGSAAVKKF